MKTRWARSAIILLLLPVAAAPDGPAPGADVQRVLASISGDSLRGNLSFLSSPLLEGRDTPSRGLDIAAEFIASQFRRAGLEPAGDDGYFQTARMLRPVPMTREWVIRVSDGRRNLAVAEGQATVISREPLRLPAVPVYRVDDAARVTPAAVAGKVVWWEARGATAGLHPAAFLQIEDTDSNPVVGRLIDPDEERAQFDGIPRVVIRDRDVAEMMREAGAGETAITISIQVPVPGVSTVTVRNVAGLLRGSDPALRSQYLLLTAHYDHLGRQEDGKIFPGANDDGSGTVSVIEIGHALAGMPIHPRRSILFVTFFGEEEGSLGSHYYTSHPLVPLAGTVADLNLEQLGRTDSTAGRELSNATLTGFEYTDIAPTLQEAGRLTGIHVYETPHDDDYFKRSDNLTFAERGVPAHTIVVAYDFPDYHEAGDVWQKIDYDNMAKVDRMIALGVILLADRAEAPLWNKANPNALEYTNRK